MKTNRFYLITSLLIIVINISAYAGPPDSVNWNLIWRDEFDGDALDPEKWTMGQEWDQEECDYPEVQVVNGKELVEVSNGTLKMKSWKEESGGKPYVGSLVKTRRSGSNPPLFTMQYGYVEVKMKRTVIGEGFHMNAYTFSYDKNSLTGSSMGGHVWPSEIDFAETLSREYYRDRILLALHNTGADEEYWTTGIDWSEWHVYAFNWKEDGYVDFYIDDEFIHSSEVPLVPDLPQYLLLRIGIGGWTGEPNEQTEYPGVQEVDWIRAYQRVKDISMESIQPSNGDVFDSNEDVIIETLAESKQGSITKVEFYADDLLLGVSEESPYLFTWESPQEGRYALSSKAYNVDGEFETSGKTYITVGDTSNNLIFNAQFDQQNENWNLMLESDAEASLQIDTENRLSGEKSANIEITDGGSSTAHINLNQKLYLEKDRKYKLSFMARSEKERSIIVKLHSEEPSNFSNYILKLADLETTAKKYEYTFTASRTDYHAKLSFSLGNDDADVYLDSVILNSDFQTSVPMIAEISDLDIYPVPVADNLTIAVPEKIDASFELQIFDVQGKKHFRQTYNSRSEISIATHHLPEGVFMLQLYDDKRIFRKRFIKIEN